MRTTIEIPDALYRRTKALAALRGSSLKDLIVEAVEEKMRKGSAPARTGSEPKLPRIRLRGGRKLDLSNFDFDDLLG